MAVVLASLGSMRGAAQPSASASPAPSPAPSLALASASISDDDRIAQLLAEAPAISEVALSPDGAWVAYTVARGSVADNRYTTELLLQRTAPEDARAEPVRVARSTGESAGAFTPRWRPDAKALAYFAEPTPPATSRALVQYAVDGGVRTPIPVRDTVSTAGGGTGRPAITSVGGDYRWSPSGARLAFTAPLRKGDGLDPRRGVAVSSQWTTTTAPSSGLFVLDVASGAVDQISPGTQHVMHFDWSPDERQLAIAATPDAEGVPVFRTDLFVIDRATHASRTLVTQPGIDDAPLWSPDGQWIAFSSRFGVPAYNSGWPAVVPAVGGAVIRLADDEGPKLSPYAPAFWTADSRGFYFSAADKMTNRLFRADVATRSVATVMPDDPGNDANFSLSRDRRQAAFTRESLTSPRELLVTALPSGTPRAITHLGAAFSLDARVKVEEVSWPSQDGKFTIHGMLLTPHAPAQGEGRDTRPAAPLPTLVYLNGGPSMFVRGFKQEGYNGAVPAMAARGYAVLVPNTRGRGGYGEAFLRGLRDGPSAGRLPYEDAMGGVDLLVTRGVADPARLGVFGHSYGGYLTSYVITQTDRFKAAVVHEAHVVEWLTGGMVSTPGTDWALLFQDLYGIRDPFDPAERARLLAESPGMNVDRVKTPTLMVFGSKSAADRVGRPYFTGLQRFHVPSEFVIYDEGHVFSRPAAVVDSLIQAGEWFDFWIRQREDPAPDKADRYGRWRALRAGATKKSE